MENITCIIIDDESSARDVLENVLENYFPSITILDKCEDVPIGVESIKTNKPNVVFLDVQMPNYAGYEIINFFDSIDFEIIFVTAYNNYAIKAFELSAIDYLVKPISREKLGNAISKLKDKLDRNSKMEDYKCLLKSIKTNKFETIIIPELGNKRFVKIKDIVAVEAFGVYSIIHLADGKKITTSKTLKFIEALFPKEHYFFRTHRSWLINLNLIDNYNKSKLEVIHASSLVSHISRRRLSEFESVFLN
jgi:two-component system LytT family response regulator